MILTAGLYGFTVMLVLASIVAAGYRRTRRFQPALYGLNLEPGEPAGSPAPCSEPRPHPRIGKPAERVASALRTWSNERATSGWAAPAGLAGERHTSAPEPNRGPKPEPKPEPKPAAQQPVREAQVKPADRAAPASAAPAPGSGPAEPVNHSAPVREDGFTPQAPLPKSADHYEILQISPNADSETIHRVYRIMASRFHPDNPTTGDVERFLRLREAYQVLSDPARRATYDATHRSRQTEPLPVFWRRSFVDGIEGEMNRRLGVLSLLYHRRRTCDGSPGVSMLELERRMAFPREYLAFTLWYLRAKGYVALQEDNSDYALTGAGVDYVERCSLTNRTIRELLSAGPAPQKRNRGRGRPRFPHLPRGSQAAADSSTRVIDGMSGGCDHLPRC